MMTPRPAPAALGVAALAAAALAVPSPAGADTFRQFQSPSHNIGCYLSSSIGARCDIRHRDWGPGPRPKGCPSFTGWGQGLIVTRSGRGHVVCAGDTTLGAGPVLPYGGRRSAGRYTCVSRTAGITCRNRSTGHGFFISREGRRLF